LGKALLGDATVTKEIRLCQEVKKPQRATEEEARREAARSAALAEKRAKSPIFFPDLQTLLASADADRRDRGLPAITMESFSSTCMSIFKTHRQPIKTQRHRSPWSKISIVFLAAHRAPPLRGIARRVESNGWYGSPSLTPPLLADTRKNIA